MKACEPGQVRKEAALSGHLQAQRECWIGVTDGGSATNTGFRGGCTVTFRRGSGRGAAPGANAPGRQRRQALARGHLVIAPEALVQPLATILTENDEPRRLIA